MVRVLFVCLGNICRSPTAEGVMRHLVAEAGLDGVIAVDSAGTGAWHTGEPPDKRTIAAANRRGVEMGGSARRVKPQDFDAFDIVVAMDRRNLQELRTLARGRAPQFLDRLALFRDFEPLGEPEQDVPDPYYGGDHAFDEVLDICFRGCQGLLDHLRQVHEL